tara:strand:- start:191 stop:913 length:723 start_codon:yes stop_codon:yes gene_type:complete
MNPSIPETLLNDLRSITTTLETNLGDILQSVVLYGGVTKNELVKDTDRVTLMIVLKEVNTATLEKVGDALDGKRQQQIQATVLTLSDLNTSMDVFPIKFLDMQQDYEVLAGEDVVKPLEIGRANLRLRCEQEIKNLMLKQRRMYMNSRSNPRALEGMLLRGYYSFLQSGDALAELITGKEYRKEEDVVEAIGAIGLDSELLKRIAALRSGESIGDDAAIKKTVGEFMAMIEKAAKMADEL